MQAQVLDYGLKVTMWHREKQWGSCIASRNEPKKRSRLLSDKMVISQPLYLPIVS